MINWEYGKLGELKKAGMPIPPTFVITGETTEGEIKEAYTTITLDKRSAAQEFMEEKEEYVVIKNSETIMNVKGKEQLLEIIKRLKEPVIVQLMINADKTGKMEVNDEITIKGSLGLRIMETDEYHIDKGTYEIKETKVVEQHKKIVRSEGELAEKTIKEKNQKINDKEIREIARQGKKASKYGVTQITWAVKDEEVYILNVK